MTVSRSVELVELERITDTSDNWYLELRKSIESEPNRYPYFNLHKNKILKFCRQRKASDAWRILIPGDVKKHVLYECHDHNLSAHNGFHKTLQRVRQYYYWPKMTNDIQDYVRRCDICKATKPRNEISRAPMGKYRDAKRPWRMITLDFCGPYPLSKSRNRFLLVVVDAFSKYVLMRSMTRSGAIETVNYLKKEVFLKFGVPEILISDNGPQLRSRAFQELLEQYNVKHWKTASYHPQANATEAANKTIVNAIRAYIGGITDQRNWDGYLTEIACAINTSVHSSTDKTPYSVNYGHEMALDGNEYEWLIDPNHTKISHGDKIDRIREDVARKLKETYERSKKRYDLRARPISYKVGDVVWLKNFKQSNAEQRYASKLDHKFIKCVVARRTGTNTYDLNGQNGKYVGNFSTSHIKQ